MCSACLREIKLNETMKKQLNCITFLCYIISNLHSKIHHLSPRLSPCVCLGYDDLFSLNSFMRGTNPYCISHKKSVLPIPKWKLFELDYKGNRTIAKQESDITITLPGFLVTFIATDVEGKATYKGMESLRIATSYVRNWIMIYNGLYR